MGRLVKSSRKIVAIAVAVIAVFIAGWEANMAQGPKSNKISSEEYQAVEQTINNVIGWAVDKDFDLFFASIGDDSSFISVTPYKRVKFGVEEVKKDTGFWADPGFKAIRHEVRDLHINFAPSGEVAWYYCELDDINELNGQPANWEGVRWTGVVVKKDGHWRVVQQHFSFPKG